MEENKEVKENKEGEVKDNEGEMKENKGEVKGKKEEGEESE